mmetsp:Transcript_1661/g.3160  ORF Transcript_1661/g.3160 Transcript_1661/m.3160 type:complete len:87 (+) Transcript_1661:664-924(+)
MPIDYACGSSMVDIFDLIYIHSRLKRKSQSSRFFFSQHKFYAHRPATAAPEKGWQLKEARDPCSAKPNPSPNNYPLPFAILALYLP